MASKVKRKHQQKEFLMALKKRFKERRTLEVPSNYHRRGCMTEDNWEKQMGYSKEEMGIYAGMMKLKQSETLTQKLNKVGENRLVRVIFFTLCAILGYVLLGMGINIFIGA